jgi:threonyl-tRNA synthetase
MRPEDKTIGLTFMWNLSEEKLREILAPNQIPRIQNGTGVLMLFLCLRTVMM